MMTTKALIAGVALPFLVHARLSSVKAIPYEDYRLEVMYLMDGSERAAATNWHVSKMVVEAMEGLTDVFKDVKLAFATYNSKFSQEDYLQKSGFTSLDNWKRIVESSVADNTQIDPSWPQVPPEIEDTVYRTNGSAGLEALYFAYKRAGWDFSPETVRVALISTNKGFPYFGLNDFTDMSTSNLPSPVNGLEPNSKSSSSSTEPANKERRCFAVRELRDILSNKSAGKMEVAILYGLDVLQKSPENELLPASRAITEDGAALIYLGGTPDLTGQLEKWVKQRIGDPCPVGESVDKGVKVDIVHLHDTSISFTKYVKFTGDVMKKVIPQLAAELPSSRFGLATYDSKLEEKDFARHSDLSSNPRDYVRALETALAGFTLTNNTWPQSDIAAPMQPDKTDGEAGFEAMFFSINRFNWRWQDDVLRVLVFVTEESWPYHGSGDPVEEVTHGKPKPAPDMIPTRDDKTSPRASKNRRCFKFGEISEVLTNHGKIHVAVLYGLDDQGKTPRQNFVNILGPIGEDPEDSLHYFGNPTDQTGIAEYIKGFVNKKASQAGLCTVDTP